MTIKQGETGKGKKENTYTLGSREGLSTEEKQEQGVREDLHAGIKGGTINQCQWEMGNRREVDDLHAGTKGGTVNQGEREWGERQDSQTGTKERTVN